LFSYQIFKVLVEEFSYYLKQPPFMIPKVLQTIVYVGSLLNLCGPVSIFVLGILLVSTEISTRILGIISICLGVVFLILKLCLLPISCLAPKSGLYYTKFFDPMEYERLRKSYQTADTAIYKKEWLRSSDWEQIY
jgi:hypothetical protein